MKRVIAEHVFAITFFHEKVIIDTVCIYRRSFIDETAGRIENRMKNGLAHRNQAGGKRHIAKEI